MTHIPIKYLILVALDDLKPNTKTMNINTIKILPFLTLTLLSVTYVYSQSANEKVKAKLSSLSWLEGNWKRMNIKKPGRSAYEQWKKNGDYEFTGLGVTLQGSDTISVEKLKIIIQGHEIHYVADVAENTFPVHFTFTTLNDHDFICENPNHDYPKKISYQLEGPTLKAQTSGGGKVQEFLFEKVD